MRKNMARSSSGRLSNIFFEQDNALTYAGFDLYEDQYAGQVRSGIDGAYFYTSVVSSTSGQFGLIDLDKYVTTLDGFSFNAGDEFNLSFDIQWYNPEAHKKYAYIRQLVRVYAVDTEHSGSQDTYSGSYSSELVFLATPNIVQSTFLQLPIALETRSIDFSVPSGFEKGFYISVTLETEALEGSVDVPDPYVGINIKDFKLELTGRV